VTLKFALHAQYSENESPMRLRKWLFHHQHMCVTYK